MISSELRALGIAADYAGLHELLRARQAELGLSYETIDDIAGLTCSRKLLTPKGPFGDAGAGVRCTGRGIGPVALGPLLGALGLKLIVAADEAATARLKRRQNYMRRNDKCVTARLPGIDAMIQQRADAMIEQRTRAKLQEIGRLGHLRWLEKLTPEQRSRQARNAARIRWLRHWRSRKLERHG